VVFVALMFDPDDSEGIGRATEEAEIEGGCACAYTALVFVGGDIEPMVQAALDAPVVTVGLEHPRRREFRHGATADEELDFDLVFGLVSAVNEAGESAGLLGKGKADLLGGHIETLDRSGLHSPLVQFHCLDHIRHL